MDRELVRELVPDRLCKLDGVSIGIILGIPTIYDTAASAFRHVMITDELKRERPAPL